MNVLAVLNDNDYEPTGYIDRHTVKAVIINDKKEVLLFNGALPGGGVEAGETDMEALARECMEEIGAVVSIDKPLGTVIQYRDAINRKYIFNGYQCTLISLSKPTTTIKGEIGGTAAWEKITDAIVRIEKEISDKELMGSIGIHPDHYQSSIFNRETALTFLRLIN